jgi:hypothetical protein
MANLYRKTDMDGKVKQATNLPDNMDPAEKAKLLDTYASKLNADATAAEALSLTVPPDAQPALKQMADSARKGEEALRATARGVAAPAAGSGAQTAASAQSSLSAEDKIRLLEANSALIVSLVHGGINMSNAGTQVDRVEQCRMVSRSLVNAIGQAAEAQNAERVAELTDLFGSFARGGLVPTIDEAKRDIPPQSPDALKLRPIRESAANDLAYLRTTISQNEKVRENQHVKDVLKQLDDLTEALKV